MTEFKLSESCVFGLMAESGIKKLLGQRLSDPLAVSGIPRADLYLHGRRALHSNAMALSDLALRD